MKTRWISSTTYSQWIQVDLEFYQSINRTKIFWKQAYSSMYSIQIAGNSTNWKTVAATNQGMDEINDINFITIEVRYVRLSTEKSTVK